MGWITLYITGREGFREEVSRKLSHSDLDIMPGYTGGTGSTGAHDLYWIDEKTDLRKLKEAIGGKLIWKYRLRFYTSLESFIAAQESKKSTTEFTAEETALVEEARALYYREAS